MPSNLWRLLSTWHSLCCLSHAESTHKTEWAAVKAVFEAAGLKVNKWDYSDYK